jgi:hypothetical protein
MMRGFDLMNEVHEQVAEQLAAYALDALDLQDLGPIEEHLSSCDDCQAILEEYKQIGEGLLHIPQTIKPPAGVRSRLIAALALEPEKPNLAHRLLELPWLRLGAIGAFVALLTINITSFAQSRDLQQQVELLAAQQQSSQTGLALASYPNAKTAQIFGEKVGGTFVYDPGVRIAVAYIWGLDQLETDQIYQAWLISPDGSRTSGGLIQPETGSDFTVMVIDSPLPLSEFIGFGMTIEPAGGSSGPTGPKVLGAEL